MSKTVGWGKTAVMAGLLLALGSFAYWYEYSFRPKKEDSETATKRIFSDQIDLKSSPVKAVILNGIKANFSFECQDPAGQLCKVGDNAKWLMTTPSRFKADDANVNSFLSSINSANTEDVLDLTTETPEKRAQLLKEYGLDTSQLTQPGAKWAEFSLSDGRKLRLYLGLQHPIGNKWFALIEVDGELRSNRVLVLPSYFKNHFERELTYFRDKKLLGFQTMDIQKVEVLTPGQPTISAQKTESSWAVTSSQSKDSYVGDIESIESYLAAATHLSAKSFLVDSKSAPSGQALLKGATPSVKVVFTPKSENNKTTAEPVTLQIFRPQSKKGDAKNSVIATVSNLDPVFELESGAKDRMSKTLKDLRLSRIITAMDRYLVRKIELTGGSLGTEKIALFYKDAKWFLDSDHKKESDTEKVQRFLDKLPSTKIRDFVTSQSALSDQAKGIVLKLYDESGKEKHAFQIWSDKNQDVLVRDLLSSRKEAFVMEQGLKDVLPSTHDHFEVKAGQTPTPKLEAEPEEDATEEHDEHDGHDH